MFAVVLTAGLCGAGVAARQSAAVMWMLVGTGVAFAAALAVAVAFASSCHTGGALRTRPGASRCMPGVAVWARYLRASRCTSSYRSGTVGGAAWDHPRHDAACQSVSAGRTGAMRDAIFMTTAPRLLRLLAADGAAPARPASGWR